MYFLCMCEGKSCCERPHGYAFELALEERVVFLSRISRNGLPSACSEPFFLAGCARVRHCIRWGSVYLIGMKFDSEIAARF